MNKFLSSAKARRIDDVQLRVEPPNWQSGLGPVVYIRTIEWVTKKGPWAWYDEIWLSGWRVLRWSHWHIGPAICRWWSRHCPLRKDCTEWRDEESDE